MSSVHSSGVQSRERKEGAMVRFDPRLVALAVGVASLGATPVFAQSAQTAPSPVMVARPAVQQPATQPPHSYMKINGVTGEPTDTAHPGWLEIHSFQWGTRGFRASLTPSTPHSHPPPHPTLTLC